MTTTDLIQSSSIPWLTIMVAWPLVAGALVGLIPGLRARGRLVALGASLIELVLGIIVATQFDWTTPATHQLGESYSWIPQMGVSWALGVNALGLVMILLAVALVPLVLLAAPARLAGSTHEGDARDADADERESREGAYSALILVLEMFMVVIFAAFDVIVFYIAFEAMLVPLFFMIGTYGVGEAVARRKAAIKFLLYSLAGGLAMLGGLVALWAVVPQKSETFFRLDTLSQFTPMLPSSWAMGIFWAFMVAFIIKAPMVPVHTWLPDTAAVARPGTSVLLVGVLDKIGTFGMITLCVSLFPQAAAKCAVAMCVAAIVSILWGGLAAIGQNDIMRLVSYTSVSHFGFMVLGIFIGSQLALTGAMIYMVAHGVSIAAMFLISGFLTRRGGTREIPAYRGMQRVTPVIAGTWLVSGLASIALPGLSGFVPEYMVLMGSFSVSVPIALFAVLGVIIAALYVLLPYQKVFTGPPNEPMRHLTDMNGREKAVVTPLIIAMAVIGLWSAPIVGALTPVSDQVLNAGSAASAPAQTDGQSSDAPADTSTEGSSK